MAGGNLSDCISNLTDFQNTVGAGRRRHAHSNFPSWRSLSGVCLAIWVSVLKTLHVSSHWYFSHRMLLLWERCSPAAFDWLHALPPPSPPPFFFFWARVRRARDVECLWINWWGLLYSEYHFFFSLPPSSPTLQFLKNTVSLSGGGMGWDGMGWGGRYSWRAVHIWAAILQTPFHTAVGEKKKKKRLFRTKLRGSVSKINNHHRVVVVRPGLRTSFSEQFVFWQLEANVAHAEAWKKTTQQDDKARSALEMSPLQTPFLHPKRNQDSYSAAERCRFSKRRRLQGSSCSCERRPGSLYKTGLGIVSIVRFSKLRLVLEIAASN